MINAIQRLALRQPEAAQSVSAAGPAALGAPAEDLQAGFGDMLAQVAGDALARLKQGEATALAHVQGKASIQQVVEAVMAAEKTLQTAVAVRDKVVTAYQEISRMTI